jgi:hypothetical protein
MGHGAGIGRTYGSVASAGVAGDYRDTESRSVASSNHYKEKSKYSILSPLYSFFRLDKKGSMD